MQEEIILKVNADVHKAVRNIIFNELKVTKKEVEKTIQDVCERFMQSQLQIEDSIFTNCVNKIINQVLRRYIIDLGRDSNFKRSLERIVQESFENIIQKEINKLITKEALKKALLDD